MLADEFDYPVFILQLPSPKAITILCRRSVGNAVCAASALPTDVLPIAQIILQVTVTPSVVITGKQVVVHATPVGMTTQAGIDLVARTLDDVDDPPPGCDSGIASVEALIREGDRLEVERTARSRSVLVDSAHRGVCYRRVSRSPSLRRYRGLDHAV